MSLPATAFLLYLLSAPSSADAWQSQRFLAFGERNSWVLINPLDRSLIRIALPTPSAPTSFAVSNDGSQIAFTAWDPQAGAVLLFLWNRTSEAKPRSIGMKHGRHGDVTFGPDGWIYFAHHAGLDTPAGEFGDLSQASCSSAQLWRIHPDGMDLQRLTNEVGCHYSPIWMSGRLFFIHKLAPLNRRLESFDPRASGLPRIHSGELHRMDELAGAPDGRSLLIAVERARTTAIKEVSLDGKILDRLEIDRFAPEARAQFGRTRAEIFIQSQGYVWLSKSQTLTRFVALNPPPEGPR